MIFSLSPCLVVCLHMRSISVKRKQRTSICNTSTNVYMYIYLCTLACSRVGESHFLLVNPLNLLKVKELTLELKESRNLISLSKINHLFTDPQLGIGSNKFSLECDLMTSSSSSSFVS